MLRYIPWATLLIGLCLIVAPYIFGFAGVTAALVNSIALGVILAVASCACQYFRYRGAEAGQKPSQQKA